MRAHALARTWHTHCLHSGLESHRGEARIISPNCCYTHSTFGTCTILSTPEIITDLISNYAHTAEANYKHIPRPANSGIFKSISSLSLG
jgi:hypothetical protein